MSTSEAIKPGDQSATVLAYLGLGSNLGDRAATLNAALAALDALERCRVVTVSGFIETAPAFVVEQPDFLNACAILETSLAPLQLLTKLQGIERELGRIRKVVNGPRTLDLDILFYDDQILDVPGLTVPHPGAHERRFVLEPLAEIAGDLIHPGLGRSIATILGELAE